MWYGSIITHVIQRNCICLCLCLVQKCKSLRSELPAQVALLPVPEPWPSPEENGYLWVWFLHTDSHSKRQHSNVNEWIQNKKKKKHCQGIMEIQFICKLCWTCFALLYGIYLSALLSRSDPSWGAMNQCSNLPLHHPQPFWGSWYPAPVESVESWS